MNLYGVNRTRGNEICISVTIIIGLVSKNISSIFVKNITGKHIDCNKSLDLYAYNKMFYRGEVIDHHLWIWNIQYTCYE